MKKTVSLFFSLCASSLLAVPPSIETVTLSLSDRLGEVVVHYTLANPPAIVTATFTANGERLPDTASWYMLGDINAIVTNTSGSFTWNFRHTVTNLDTSDLSVTLTAWTLEAPPLYCCIDLSEGPTATTYPMEFYTSSNAVPGGVPSDTYKTCKMLFRRIPRSNDDGFTMGSPSSESGRNAAREAERNVVLTHDFYMAVYECTQEQWQRITGSYEFSHLVDDVSTWPFSPRRPAEHLSVVNIRGSRAEGVNWPSTTNYVASGSVAGKLRSRTGNIYLWDLPTEAQWEYACRAGTTGKSYDATLSLSEMAVYGRNDGLDKPPSVDGTQIVGTKIPNAWGLYDMLGNVMEWCNDWRQENTSSLPRINPVGPNAFTDSQGVYYRIARGGGCRYGSGSVRPAHRNSWDDTKCDSAWGFRFSATLGAHWDTSTTPPTLY